MKPAANTLTSLLPLLSASAPSPTPHPSLSPTIQYYAFQPPSPPPEIQCNTFKPPPHPETIHNNALMPSLLSRLPHQLALFFLGRSELVHILEYTKHFGKSHTVNTWIYLAITTSTQPNSEWHLNVSHNHCTFSVCNETEQCAHRASLWQRMFGIVCTQELNIFTLF